MMAQADFVPLVGESAEVIAQAEARRASIIEAARKLSAHGWNSFERADFGRGLAWMAEKANSAAWWLRDVRDDADDERYVRYIVRYCAQCRPREALLPDDWYSAERVAERTAAHEAATAEAAAVAKFTGLPALRGTPKQVAWALTIRESFRRWCEDCGESDAFMAIAKMREAKSARFWIDNRNPADFDLLVAKKLEV